jgi:2-iminoacetate synthase ThiH
MNLPNLLNKALDLEFLTKEEGLYLYNNASLTELMFVADELRKKQVPHGKVTWIIDRKRILAKELISDDNSFVKSLSKEDVEYLFS